MIITFLNILSEMSIALTCCQPESKEKQREEMPIVAICWSSIIDFVLMAVFNR